MHRLLSLALFAALTLAPAGAADHVIAALNDITLPDGRHFTSIKRAFAETGDPQALETALLVYWSAHVKTVADAETKVAATEAKQAQVISTIKTKLEDQTLDDAAKRAAIDAVVAAETATEKEKLLAKLDAEIAAKQAERDKAAAAAAEVRASK